MSFHVTIKSGKLDVSHQNSSQKVSVVITSTQERIIGSFSTATSQPTWDDSFIAKSSERQLEFMLIKQKQKGKSATRLSSNFINLSKFLFQQKPQSCIFLFKTDQIHLYESSGNSIDSITIQVLYVSSMNFIGPIQFYRKAGSKDFQDQQQENSIQIEGDNKDSPFWKKWLQKVKNKQGKLAKILQEPDQMDNVKFYKGAHKNRNIFSFCDQVYDDQKFTVVENYYNDQ